MTLLVRVIELAPISVGHHIGGTISSSDIIRPPDLRRDGSQFSGSPRIGILGKSHFRRLLPNLGEKRGRGTVKKRSDRAGFIGMLVAIIIINIIIIIIIIVQKGLSRLTAP